MSNRYFVRYTETALGRLGVSHDLIAVGGEPYLERWILWLGIGTVRLHRFLAGDDDSRGPHDHPWWFVTIPFRGYTELVPDADGVMTQRSLRAWRPHFRRSSHQHLVEPGRGPGSFDAFYSIVITGPRRRRWGFWRGSEFTPAADNATDS